MTWSFWWKSLGLFTLFVSSFVWFVLFVCPSSFLIVVFVFLFCCLAITAVSTVPPAFAKLLHRFVIWVDFAVYCCLAEVLFLFRRWCVFVTENTRRLRMQKSPKVKPPNDRQHTIRIRLQWHLEFEFGAKDVISS